MYLLVHETVNDSTGNEEVEECFPMTGYWETLGTRNNTPPSPLSPSLRSILREDRVTPCVCHRHSDSHVTVSSRCAPSSSLLSVVSRILLSSPRNLSLRSEVHSFFYDHLRPRLQTSTLPTSKRSFQYPILFPPRPTHPPFSTRPLWSSPSRMVGLLRNRRFLSMLSCTSVTFHDCTDIRPY